MVPSSVEFLISLFVAFCLTVHVSYSACVESPPSLPEPCTYIETAYIPKLTTVYAFGGNSSNSMFTWNISGATQWIDHGLVPIPEPVSHDLWYSFANSIAQIDNLLYFAGVTLLSPSMLIFDTNTNIWLDTSHIPDPPKSGVDGCVAHNITHLFLVGGKEVGTGDRLQIYDIAQNDWSTVQMPMTGIANKRYWGQFCWMYSNILYVFGGYINARGTGIDGIYTWQRNDGWNTIGTLPKAIGSGDAEKHPLNNNIWIVGGYDPNANEIQDTIYQFNLETQSITNTYHMAMSLDVHATEFIGNDLYTFGGFSETNNEKLPSEKIQICQDFVTAPTFNPTDNPSKNPTKSPSRVPSPAPTSVPTQRPTPVPTKSTPITAIPTTNEPSPSPTTPPTDDPAHTPSAKPTTSPTAVPTQHPTSNPTNKPTTPAPQPPGTLTCGDTDTGTYNGATLTFMVNLPHKGDLTFDSSLSLFEITAMEATNEEGSDLLDNDYDHDEIITLYNMDSGNYKFSIYGGTQSGVQYQIQIICPTAQPTPAPTYLPTYSPTRSVTENPTLLPTVKPSLNPSKSPIKLTTSNPTKSPVLPTTSLPTQTPTEHPTFSPSQPTPTPTFAPTVEPSIVTETPTITTEVTFDKENDVKSREPNISEDVLFAIIGVGLGGITFMLMTCAYCCYTKRAKSAQAMNSMMSSNDVGETQKNVITPNERYNAVLVSWFLHTIKLPEYLKVFVENGYDDVLMLELIEDKSHLIEMGIVCQEHQELILKEIDKLRLRAREHKKGVKKMKPPPPPTTPYANTIFVEMNKKQRGRVGENSVYERGASEFERTVEGDRNEHAVDLKSELFNNALFKRKSKDTVSGGVDV